MDDLHVLVGAVGAWVSGERSTGIMRLLTVLVFIGTAILLAWHRTRPTAIVAWALGVYVLGQLGVLVITAAMLDADVSFDRRLLLPVEVTVVLLWAATATTAARSTRGPATRSTSIALWPVSARSCAGRSFAPLGFMAVTLFALSRLWVPTIGFPQGLGKPGHPPPDPILVALADYPPDIVIATNIPEEVWTATGRASIVAPAPINKLSGRATANFEEQVVEMGRLVGRRNGILVVLRTDSLRALRTGDIVQWLPCASLVVEQANGQIYDLRPCS